MSVEEMSRFMRELEHTADVMYLVESESLIKLFEIAALGMFSYITDLNTVNEIECVSVKAEGFDLESLMYRWLENLLIEHDLRKFVARRVRVDSITIRKTENEESFLIEGFACGERFDREKHPAGIVVKAVTYSQMSIERDANGIWRTKIVLDI
ncbi:MAG: archease [Sulfolobales archaeon]